MATKSKVLAKSSGTHKAPGKTSAKTAPKAGAKTAHKTPQKSASKSVKKPAAKPSASRKTSKAAPAAKGSAKTVAKTVAKTAPKPSAQKPAASKVPAAGASKTAASKPVPAKTNPKAKPKAVGAALTGPKVVASASAEIGPPPPKPPLRTVQPVSPKDLASAHEYLLTRSASRSGEPVIVDGKPLLTEEQLLAMPESQYMNGAQLAFFRYRLQQIERELLSNADETTEHLRETVIVPDPADRATIEEEHALELRTRDRERKLLKKVQGSLAQIEAGEYGYCEETGEPIGIPRLLARPTATLSLEAQQRREIKQKLFGD